MNNCQAPEAVSGHCQRTDTCAPGRCHWAELRKEVWDVGQCPFLLFAAAKAPGCAVRLIDGYTLESIGGYVPHDWNGIQYDVLDMHEADKMRRNHPDEFAKFSRGTPAANGER